MRKAFAIALLMTCFALPATGEEIRYCEPISDEAGQWRYPDENAYYRELTIQAERLAVESVYAEELASFHSEVLDRATLADALTDFLAYERETDRGEKQRDFCVTLTDIRKKEAAGLFPAVEIGRVCHFDETIRRTLIDGIRDRFIGSLRDKAPLGDALLSLIEDPTNIAMKTEAQLRRYINEGEVEADPGAIPEAACTALTVRPIELYAASSKREISSVISVMPAIETRDTEDRKGEFQLVVIDSAYHWVRGSEDEISVVGDIDNFTAPFVNETFQAFVRNNFRDLICIGMASCEGEAPEENRRGLTRAEKVVARLAEAFDETSGLSIYGLNLGKHRYDRKECHQLSDEARAAQRIVMLVGVTKRSDPDVAVKAALQNAMERMAASKQDLLPINPADYLLFDFLKGEAEG
jgi:hypothetical protein